MTYGGPSTGKTHTMVGSDDSNTTVGVLPCAISWLYSLINDCKERISARISVRVSAVEVVGKNETLKDLLAEQTSGKCIYSVNRLCKNLLRNYTKTIYIIVFIPDSD